MLHGHSRDQDDNQTKMWYFQDRFRSMPEKQIELETNNISFNRVYLNPQLSLVIKDFDNSDAGIYRCRGNEGQEEEYKFNYRLEPVYKDESNTLSQKGNLSDWENYREVNLVPVTTRFAVSRMSGLREIREAGVILEAVSEWGPWSVCERCIHRRGFKTSRANCRVKSRPVNVFIQSQINYM
ncbi:uncharacterized protein LOC105698480 isoform X2 [Orussus abietinus]|uniref:uncharacterized protein LOC105698480 isoform X2 n=1 Tax=Orussus abietinus TaxID=222816 RepID=UPI000C7162B1|nr:uncharacterized protein LOC105698480 isoform X2 [Orussus abietinus]